MPSLPLIPTPEQLASDVMSHRVDDQMFNPPCAQNEWGHAQCANNITAFNAQQFPPYLANSMTAVPWTPIFMPTCEFFLDGRLFAAWPRPNGLIHFQWFPHQVVRETTVDNLQIRTELFLPPLRRTVAMRIVVQNLSGQLRAGTYGFSLVANVARANFNINGKPGFLGSAEGGYEGDDPEVLPLAEPLCEVDNEPIALPTEGGILFRAIHSEAWCMQGFSRQPIELPQLRHAVLAYDLAVGATETLYFVSTMGASRDGALNDYRVVMKSFEAIQASAREAWRQRLENAYTPGNTEFSGHLPTLSTQDSAMWKLYHMGTMTALFCRVCSPDAVFGPAYLAVRGQQRPARVYIWDTGLCSKALALLDPEALRRVLEQWFLQHPDRNMDIDYITGKSVENHYATNQMMLVYACDNYLQVTDDRGWLDKKVGRQTVFEHLHEAAVFWNSRRDKLGMGLADHTESDLLEVVSTYHGIVAALQAGNVYAMRYVASLCDERKEHARAAELRASAAEVVQSMMRHLYVEGKGTWRSFLRDGTSREVKTCYDFLTVFQMIPHDLSAGQRSEMIRFFWNELSAPAWMYALSPRDPDAAWNKRADHTWCGSYPQWPPLCGQALLQFDSGERTVAWIRSLARTANQGPFGQSHLVPGPFPDENGGARKAPLVMPLLSEWAALAGLGFVVLVVESIFGIQFGKTGPTILNSRVGDFDPSATLTNLRWKKINYVVTGTDVKQSASVG